MTAATPIDRHSGAASVARWSDEPAGRMSSFPSRVQATTLKVARACALDLSKSGTGRPPVSHGAPRALREDDLTTAAMAKNSRR